MAAKTDSQLTVADKWKRCFEDGNITHCFERAGGEITCETGKEVKARYAALATSNNKEARIKYKKFCKDVKDTNICFIEASWGEPLAVLNEISGYLNRWEDPSYLSSYGKEEEKRRHEAKHRVGGLMERQYLPSSHKELTADKRYPSICFICVDGSKETGRELDALHAILKPDSELGKVIAAGVKGNDDTVRLIEERHETINRQAKEQIRAIEEQRMRGFGMLSRILTRRDRREEEIRDGRDIANPKGPSR